MDIFNKNKNEKDENKTKKVVKRHMLVAAVILAVKIFLMLLMIFAVVAVIEWLVKIFQPKNTVDKIYKELKIEDVSELVQIKGNTTDGYYLDFVDDIDKKLQDTIDYLNSTAGVKSGIDKEFLKKMIKTEVVTQMPDLGAEVSDDKGFQGITSILRITPNKDIGSFKNTGAGKETIKNEDDSDKNNMANKSEIAKQEKEVKTWKKGKELTLSAKAFVYSQEDSKLHPGEKIDYWTAQKNKNTLQNLYLSKGTAVKYTGQYSISVDKMTNEGLIYVGIEKDDIKGYIKYNFINKDSGEAGSKDDDEVTNSGYQETGEEKTTDTIDSNVYKLKYVPQKTFDEYVSNGNKEALYCFTIDDDGNLITATWSIGEDGKIEIQNNSAINLKTALQNYIVPSAYLLYYYIEADYPDFSNELADIALNSKIIMALEDNVSTSKIKRTVETKKVSESSEFSYDWTGGDPTEIITEYCSTKTEIIYADTWCVKIENKSLYKSDLLDVTVGKSKNIKIPGTVTENDGQEEISGEKETGSGTDTKEETNVVIENGKPIIKTTTYTYAYKTYQRTRTITDSISNSYAEADKVKPEAKEKVFTDLYKKHKMYNRLNDKRFLQILENDEKTANLVDLTKYLMYMATGVDYGVKEYEFSEYEKTSFENVTASYGDYVVKTNDPASATVVTDKKKMEEGLKKWLKNASNQKTKAISVLDTVMDCQEKYHVNAVFVYAFLRTETGIGTADTNYVKNDNNWGSWNLGHTFASPQDNIITITSKMESGGIYFSKGNISVSQIGAIYCPNDAKHPTQGDDWIKVVNGHMNDLYSAMGLQGSIASGGKGTIGAYISTKNLKYNLYLQGNPAPWAGEDYGDSHSMAKAGCGPTAAAIIASAYNANITPSTVRQSIVSSLGLGNHSSATWIQGTLKKLIPNVKTEVAAFNEEKIKKCLENSGQVWFVVQNCKYTSGAHCMALIDYKDSGMVYVAHGTAKTRPYGWNKLSELKSYNKYSEILYVGGK